MSARLTRHMHSAHVGLKILPNLKAQGSSGKATRFKRVKVASRKGERLISKETERNPEFEDVFHFLSTNTQQASYMGD